MALITLVRHGQANTGAQDEASYDNLSPLGRQQADWLGNYMSDTGQRFDRIICGTLHRQRQTAERIAQPLELGVTQDTRLNEIDYFGLAASLEASHKIPLPTNREGFMLHLPQVMAAWQSGDISTPVESFENYEARVRSMLATVEADGNRSMLVTSGGIIGMVVRLALGLDMAAFSHVLLQINNSSIHRYLYQDGARLLECFNGIPHLDPIERSDARTYI